MLDIFASFRSSALVVRARLMRIGNSRGIRIPKPLLEQVGLRDTVQIRAEKGRLVIQAEKGLRQGWEDAFRLMADRGTNLHIAT
jgi:antitoxin MazE